MIKTQQSHHAREHHHDSNYHQPSAMGDMTPRLPQQASPDNVYNATEYNFSLPRDASASTTRERSSSTPKALSSSALPPRTSSTPTATSNAASRTTRDATTTPTKSRPSGESRSALASSRSADRVPPSEAYPYQRSPALATPIEQRRPSKPRTPNLAKEPETVLNRVVISDPVEDGVRATQRMDEADAKSPRENPPPDSATKKRQDFSNNNRTKKEIKFGEYVLGQTLGEGEFGKVKLGWKKDGSAEVAIKLIRRETLTGNPSRLPKIYREVNILMGLKHPNIVKLHEMLETDRYIGIVLEYASGGELFDYILHHRFLNDTYAKRLFAQLISGVGYLHKVGIVHRDLKLENLLLDRHKNIIITDFGFANTFDPNDQLTEEIEANISNKDFVKRLDLDKLSPNTGWRRGDLMATSCGSPCYAAPELVVTDGLYTGRKVDVWSCGVILYAMLAGYLPFDDDPANPEGDNINLLYKYIISTPLTFPEYVSPHSRDLLKRMLVPEPCNRADLFEVARHTWMAPYISSIAQYTSMNADASTIPIMPVSMDKSMAPQLARSASVREPVKVAANSVGQVGGLTHQSKTVSPDSNRPPRDSNRRTIQVEYVAPQSQTAREGMSPPTGDRTQQDSMSKSTTRKPLPTAIDPNSNSTDAVSRSAQQPSKYSMPPPVTRPARDMPRSVSDSTSAFAQYTPPTIARPGTGGSMSSSIARHLPSRGNSYSQPLAPTVAATNAQARMSQPQPQGPRYNISAPIPQPEAYIGDDANGRRPVSQRIPIRSSNAQSDTAAAAAAARGHKRSSTLSNLFGKSGSLFSTTRKETSTPVEAKKPEKRYPPTSMRTPIASPDPRPSSESKRSRSASRKSFGFNRRPSDLSKEKNRRFSLLPPAFSMRNTSASSKDLPAPEDGGTESSLHHPDEWDQQGYADNRYTSNQYHDPYSQGYHASATAAVSEPMIIPPKSRVLQKQHKNFSEAYSNDDQTKYSGTSGPARRVMDFFRRRGRARAGDE